MCMRQMEARGRLLQKEGRKRIYLIIIISWSIRISKKKTIADIFRLVDYLPYLFESSCHSILDFLFFYLSYSFIFFEYGGLIVSLRYIFISTFLLLDIFTVLFTIPFTVPFIFEADPRCYYGYLKNLHFATSILIFQSSTSLSWIQTGFLLP